jgi:hypothetical protein
MAEKYYTIDKELFDNFVGTIRGMRYDKFSISGDEIVENILGLGTYIN